MVRALSTAPKPAYERFLFAAIGEDPNGVPVTVLSALARADLDPWSEATSLAFLPRGMAAERLAKVIAGLPDIPKEQTTPENAERLVALLPNAIQASAVTEALMPEKKIRMLAWAFTMIVMVIATIAIQWVYARHVANGVPSNSHVPHLISAPQQPPAEKIK